MNELNEFDVFLNGAAFNEEIEFEVSQRFKDADGNVVPWKLRPVTAEENALLRKECSKKGKKGTIDFNQELYIARLCADCVVYPNLNSAQFQDAAGVRTPHALLTKLLLSGEYDMLQAKILEINGYEFNMDELVEQAKN